MAISPEVIAAAGALVKTGVDTFVKSPKLQKTVLGTYSNGKPRSIVDACRNEVVSPDDKLMITKRLEKSKKKKTKKKKKNASYAKIDLFNF